MNEAIDTPNPQSLTLPQLTDQLRAGNCAERAAAAELLREHGPEAVEPLCKALQDWDLTVRVQAAESLALVGDERAIQPLREALQGCFLQRSPRFQVVLGTLLTWGGLVFWLSYGAMRFGKWTLWLGLVQVVAACLMIYGSIFRIAGLQPRQALVHAIVGALGQIADRNTVPELRAAVPLLKAVVSDRYHQDGAAIKSAKDALARIEASTSDLSGLPLAAAPPGATADQLPLPANSPGHQPEQLPRSCGTEPPG